MLTELNGDRYEGEFKDGVYHGKGTKTYAEFFVGKEKMVGRRYDGGCAHGGVSVSFAAAGWVRRERWWLEWASVAGRR